MKNALIIILLIVAVALGGMFVWQNHAAKTQAARLEEAKAQLAQAEAAVKEKSEASEKAAAATEQAALAETKARVLQDTLKETAASVVAQSNKVAELQAAGKTNGNPFATMFKDPDAKKLIREQQKLVLGPMIDKNYSAAFKELALTPEQTASLKGLLQDKMLVGADMGIAMLDGSLDAEKRSEMGKQVKADTDAYDAKIKDLLGEEGYKDFQSYEKTVPDRMAVNGLHDLLASSDNPMTSDQENQLVKAMSEERLGFKWTTDYNNRNPADTDFTTLFTEEKVNTFVAEKGRLDDQVLARAKTILTPEQFGRFETYQKQQRDLAVFGLKMAGKMFGK